MVGERSWDAELDCEEAWGGWAAAGLWTLSLWESLSDVGLVLTPSEWPWAADWDGLLRFRVGLTRYCRGMGPVCTEAHTPLGLQLHISSTLRDVKSVKTGEKRCIIVSCVQLQPDASFSSFNRAPLLFSMYSATRHTVNTVPSLA